MTIKGKILSLVVAFALLAAVITGLGLKTMADYNMVISAYRHAAANAFNGERLNRELTDAALDGRALYMATSQADANTAANRIDAQADKLTAFVTGWRAQLAPGELPEFNDVSGFVLDMARDGHTLARIAREQGLLAAHAYGFHPQYSADRERTQAKIDAMVARIEARQAQSQADLARFENQRGLQFLLVAAAGILIMLAGSIWLAIGSIAEPLNRVRQSMVRISQGAYDTPIPTGAMSPEIGQLWNALDILKAHAMEAERLSQLKLRQEQSLRELVLD